MIHVRELPRHEARPINVNCLPDRQGKEFEHRWQLRPQVKRRLIMRSSALAEAPLDHDQGLQHGHEGNGPDSSLGFTHHDDDIRHDLRWPCYLAPDVIQELSTCFSCF